MLNTNNNKKVVLFFIGTIYIASITNQLSAIPKNHLARSVAFILTIGIPSFISLYTKGTPKELKFKTELDDTYSWHNCFIDWIEAFKLWNVVLKPSEYKEALTKFWDKRWVGTQLSLISEQIKTKVDDGEKEITLSDKKLKCLPTGVCGKFDAYILKQCKSLFDAIGNMEKSLIVYFLLFHGKDVKKFSQLIIPSKN